MSGSSLVKKELQQCCLFFFFFFLYYLGLCLSVSLSLSLSSQLKEIRVRKPEVLKYHSEGTKIFPVVPYNFWLHNLHRECEPTRLVINRDQFFVFFLLHDMFWYKFLQTWNRAKTYMKMLNMIKVNVWCPAFQVCLQTSCNGLSVIYSALCLPGFVIPHGLSTLYRCSLTTLAQD